MVTIVCVLNRIQMKRTGCKKREKKKKLNGNQKPELHFIKTL